jgi:hypothetical protein
MHSCHSLHVPPDGKVYFAAWLDTADSSPTAKDGDRPVKLNQRMGFKFSAFQYAQSIPILAGDHPFPDDQVDDTHTDALVLLTVYNKYDPFSITDSDIQVLADQLARLTKVAKRRMLLRFLPEFNGTFMIT